MTSVLHLPFETAGQAGAQSQALRAVGIDSKTLFPGHRFAYEPAPDLTYPASPRGWSDAVKLARALQVLGRYDVYHYHYGASLLPWHLRFIDARANRWLGRRVIVEFWGSDVRKPSIERARNPWYVNAYGESDGRADIVMRHWSSITGGHVIVADHSFLPAVEPCFAHVHLVRQAIDCSRYRPPSGPRRAGPVRVVHIPSHALCKGTDIVRTTVEALRQRGLVFEYIEVQGVSHAEAMARCADADIIVDQLRLGSHGVFAIEAMALARPVLCNLMPSMVDTYPEGLPLVNVAPDTLADVLARWIDAPEAERRALGDAGRAYVERVHSLDVIGPQLAAVYAELPGRRA